MRMVTRHLVPTAEQPEWITAAESALATLAVQPGFQSGEIAAAVDQADLMLITTRWATVGDYRRALSSFEVKLNALPLLYGAVDEPTGFELLREFVDGRMASHTPARAFDADQIGIRQASAEQVRPRPN